MTPTEAELLQVLEDMNVPSERRGMSEQNLRWLNRNLGITNAKHPRYREAMTLVRYALMSR